MGSIWALEGQYGPRRGEALFLRFGPLHLVVEHLLHEWRVGTKWGDDPLEVAVEERIVPVDSDRDADISYVRYAVSSQSDHMRLVPILPDRSVVARPDAPIVVPPNERATIYINVPLWLRIETGDPPLALTEVPTARLSDTWFGPSTVEGELGYSLLTLGRVDPATLPRRPNRAVCEVRFGNRFDAPLRVERINLPVATLQLYVNQEGEPWTDILSVERSEGLGPVSVEVERRSTEPGDGFRLLGPARQQGRNVFLRAFSSLIG